MSIEAMRQVWAHSKHGGPALLLQLAIADHVNDRGIAWPSVGTLAEKIRMSERNTRYLLAKLEKSGELVVERGKGPHGCNLFRVQALQGANVAGLQNSVGEGCNALQEGAAIAIAPESSLNHQGTTSAPTTSGADAPRAEETVFGTCLDFLKTRVKGEKQARSLLGKWRGACGDDAVIAAVARAKALDVSDPVAWLTRALANKPTKTKATNYATTQYREEKL